MSEFDSEFSEQSGPSGSPDNRITIAGYVVLVDRTGSIQFAGQCEGGMTPDRLVGYSVFDRVPQEFCGLLKTKLSQVFDSRRTENINLPAPGGCDRGGNVEIKLVPLAESGKEVTTVAVAFRRTAPGSVGVRVPRTEGNSLTFAAESRLDASELPCERSLRLQREAEELARESSRMFRQLANGNFLQGVIVADAQEIIFANQQAATILEISLADLVGRPLQQTLDTLVCNDSRMIMAARHADMERGVMPEQPFEISIVTGKGNARKLELVTVPVTLQGRNVAQTVFVDITARCDAEEALRESEEKYRTVVENALNAIVIIEHDGTLKFLNPIAAQMLGGKPDNYTGKNVADIFPPTLAKRHLAAIQRVIDCNKGETIENVTEMQGQPRWQVTSIHPINGRDNHPRQAFLISTDITENKLANQRLARERDFNRSILHTANSLIFCLDEEARILVFNAECERVTGYSAEEVLGKRWPDLFVPDRYRHNGLAHFGDWVRQHPSDRREEPIVTRSGEERQILWSNSSFVHPETGAITAIAIGHDITEARRAATERDRLFNLSIDMLCIADFSGYFRQVNPAWTRTLGWQSEKLTSAPFLDLVHPDDRQATKDSMAALATSQEVLGFENRYRCADGSYRWLSWNSFPLVDENLIFAVCHDVTERNLATQALRESEQRFKDLAELLPSAVFETDLDGKFTFLNRNGLENLGYTSDDLNRGIRLADILDEADRNHALARLRDLNVEDKTNGNEYSAHRIDGSILSVKVYSSPVIRNGERVGYRGVVLDTTRSKRAEQDLRESRENYRMLVENQTDLLVKVDTEGRFLFVSPSYCELFGMSESELLGHQFMPLVHEDDRETTRLSMEKLYRPPYRDYHEQRARTKNGWKWLAWNDTSVLDPDGKVIAIIGVGRDITERKQAEEQLRQSQEAYRDLVENVDDVLYVLDANMVINYVSPVVKNVLGYEPAELQGRSALSLILEEDMPEILVAVNDVLNNKLYPSEYRMLTKSGDVRWVRTSSRPIFEGSRLTGVRGMLADVTERRRAEQALKESQQRFERVTQQSREMVWEVNADGTFTYVSQVCEEILGYLPEEMIGKMHFYDLQPEGEERQRFKTLGLQQIQQQVSFHNQINQVQAKDGHIVWFLTSGTPVLDASGNVRGYIGADLDITERRELEEDLFVKDRAIASSINALALTTLAGNFTYVNEAFVQMWGYSAAEVVGQHLNRFVRDPGDTTCIVDAVHKAGSYLGETTGIRKNSAQFNIQISAGLVTNTNGKPIALLATFLDITEQRRHIDALRLSEEKFRALYMGNPLPTFTWLWDGHDLILVDYNRQAVGITDGHIPDFTGITARKLYEDHPEIIQDLYDCLENRSSFNRDMTYQYQTTAKVLQLRVHFTFVPPDMVLVMSEDITQRKSDEEALRNSEERFRRFYQDSPLPTYTWQWQQDDLVLIDANLAAQSAPHIHIDTLLGKKARTIYGGRQDILEQLYGTMQKRETTAGEVQSVNSVTGEETILHARYTFVPPDLVLVQSEDVTQRRRDEEALRLSEEKFRRLFRGSPLPQFLFQEQKDGRIAFVEYNEAADKANKGMLKTLLGNTLEVQTLDHPALLEDFYATYKDHTSRRREVRHKLPWFDTAKTYSVFCAFIPPNLLVVKALDVSEQREMEARLLDTNEQLRIQKETLEKKNVALEVVLNEHQRAADQVRQSIQDNIDKLVRPSLAKLKDRLGEAARIELDFLEKLLSDATSPFMREIESRFVQLTPRETEICGMIRIGLQSKEIALALGIATRTAEKFRQNIRRKLGVDNRHINLVSFLRSLGPLS